MEHVNLIKSSQTLRNRCGLFIFKVQLQNGSEHELTIKENYIDGKILKGTIEFLEDDKVYASIPTKDSVFDFKKGHKLNAQYGKDIYSVDKFEEYISCVIDEDNLEDKNYYYIKDYIVEAMKMSSFVELYY